VNRRPGDEPLAELRVLNNRYRLARKLGNGGMGSVWLADDTLLERSVALKQLIKSGPNNMEERRRRALQEARAMARVRHPSIVPIHDVFFIDDDPWIVMEHINGRSLQDIIQNQTLNERTIAKIGLQVLRGLMAVHRAGVVHRDVKPTNILVADDSVFLVDFGIARIAGDASITGQSIVGTPDFLAPERFKAGYKVGPPADIWALGVTFFYALEGYSPFWRDSERGWEATMMAIVSEAPRSPSRPGRLADLTLRMLRKDPGERADAHQVLAVLEQILSGQPPAPPQFRVPAPAPADRAVPRSDEPHAQSWWREGSQAADPPLPRAPKAGQGDPGRYLSGPGGRGPQPDDARELIQNVGTDTGVALLLAMSEEDAARLLADCSPRLCGELLQGIAAAQPGTAIAILGQMRSTAAGRAFAYLQPGTAAAVVAAMTPGDALRILNGTDRRTAAGVIMELPVSAATRLLRSMYPRQRAAQVLTHVRPVTAAEILRSDGEFAATVLRHLSEPVRKQVSRHLAPSDQLG
jgi:flagellar motility protein MotE (MotC chaperone)/predicted Ser/Thr protein kinase